MQVSVTFRHMPASDPLKDHASERLTRIHKFWGNEGEAHVVLSVEKHTHKADINVHIHGMAMHATELSADMYHSIDKAVEHIEEQIKRHKDRLLTQRTHESTHAA